MGNLILRWDLQKGVITIPHFGKTKEIVENAQLFDFKLTDEDVVEIDSLNRNRRIFLYYDKIPCLVKTLINNKRKLPIFNELAEATVHKTKNRLKMMLNPPQVKPKVIFNKRSEQGFIRYGKQGY